MFELGKMPGIVLGWPSSARLTSPPAASCDADWTEAMEVNYELNGLKIFGSTNMDY